MKTRFLLTGAALLALSLAIASQQGLLLRRELKANTKEVYKIETKVNQLVTPPGMGEQQVDLTSTMTLTLNTLALKEGGSADVESVFSDIATKAEGMLAGAMEQSQQNAPKEIRSKGTLDARNRMVMQSAGQMTNPMEMMMGSGGAASSVMFIEFPEKEVAVGDTWTITAPKNPMFGNEAPTMTAKLIGEKDHDGQKVWAISVAGKIKLDADLSEQMKNMPNNPMAGMKVAMKGLIDMTGEALVDKATGKTLLYTSNAKSTGTVNLTDMGMSIDTSGVVKTTMKLQK